MRSSSLRSRVFGIDTRGLAAFRIGMGLLLLTDLWLRAVDLEAHYTDLGILPLDVLQRVTDGTGFWTFHSLHGSSTFQLFMFSLAGIFALAYLFGYYTRFAAIVSWVLLLSLQYRNPYVVNGGDVLLRMLLFWSIFLPLDRHWSLASRKTTTREATTVLNIASAAILLQVGLLYVMAGYFKLRGSWYDPNVLAGIFESDLYAKPLAHYLGDYPRLLSVASWMALVSELALPILIFCPYGTRVIRLFAFAWFVTFHIGIELTLTVGLFSFASCIAWILFLPSTAWDRITQVSASPTPNEEALPQRSWPETLVQAFVAVCFAFVVWVNLTSVREPWAASLRTEWVNDLSVMTGMRQKWSLFSKPLAKDGWFIGVARLANGDTVDVFRDGKAADWESYSKPQYVYRQFPNHRWRKYYCRTLTSTRVNLRTPLSHYLIRNWNETHDADQQIEAFELHFMQELGPDEEGVERYRQRFFSDIDLSETGQT